MAKKKKADPRDLEAVVKKLIEDVGDDRERLVSFTEGLIATYDGEKAVGIAEYVAKLADALTKQHAITASLVKSLAKAAPNESDGSDDFDNIQDQIGMPFKPIEVDDGSN